MLFEMKLLGNTFEIKKNIFEIKKRIFINAWKEKGDFYH